MLEMMHPVDVMNRIESSGRLHGRSAIPFLLLGVFALAMFSMALLASGKGLRNLDVTCNYRLLDSVSSWLDHGFWQLGGLLSFRDDRTAAAGLPESLYKSQSSLYVIPHYIATAIWGEEGFWAMVRTTTVVFAGVMATCCVTLTSLFVEEHQPAGGSRWLLPLSAFTAFAAALPQEGIWGSLWNYDDRALATVLLTMAATSWGLGIRSERRWPQQLGSVLLITAALACPRMGAMLVLVAAVAAWLDPKQGLFDRRLAMACGLATVAHYLRVLLVDSWGIFNLKGTGPLVRFGFTHEVLERGQSSLPYDHILQAFTFAWRQSQWSIDELSLSTNLQHLAVYLLAGLGLILLLLDSEAIRSRYRSVLVLMIAPALLWTVLIHQSVAEHPDVHAIMWAAPFALGWAWLVLCICRWLSKRLGDVWTVFAGCWIAYWLFLWQVQYLLRAYPNLRW